MSAATESPTKMTIRLGPVIVIVVASAAINVLFYFLSARYFADRAAMAGDTYLKAIGDLTIEAQLSMARKAFGMFSGVVTLGVIAATLHPRAVGHAIAALGGLAAVVASFATFGSNIDIVMPVSLLGIGMLLAAMVYGSLRGSRASWAFLAATCAVLATITLFGATKVRVALDVGIWHALILPGLFIVATSALAMVRTDYAER